MIQYEKRLYNMLVRVHGFGGENAADFPLSSPGGKAFAEISEAVADLDEMGINLSSPPQAPSEQLQLKKITARENLREFMMMLSRAARAMAYEINGLEHKFRMPRGDNDQKLFAAARVFAADAPAFKADFIDYGLPEDFLESLNEEIIAFNQAVSTANTAIDSDSGAISAVTPLIKNAMITVRKLNVIVRNKFSRDPQKLAAWLIASHIEHDPFSDE